MGMIVYPSFFVRSSVTGSRGAAFSMTATPNKRTAPAPREPSCGWCVHWKVPTALTGIRTWPHQWQRHCLRAKVPVIVYHWLKNWMTKVVTRNQELLVLSTLELIPDSKDNNTSMFLGACFFVFFFKSVFASVLFGGYKFNKPLITAGSDFKSSCSQSRMCPWPLI